MRSQNHSSVVVGVDVGGMRKGFHAVALRDGRYLEKLAALAPSEVSAWCLALGAEIVGVDAPCRWSQTGRARQAEQELMAERIWCFSTPRREVAVAHATRHFEWVLNGEALFNQLRKTYRLFDGGNETLSDHLCFETFPQAVACALAGKIVGAKRKGTVRRALLDRAGVDTTGLSNIDMVDAALCALTAYHLTAGNVRTYGDTVEGFIVVPGKQGAALERE